jgi:hypothetical protein
MPEHAIPSAYLIRALARREAEHCDRCGDRMFVKGASGLCPFCLADRPVRPLAMKAARIRPDEPFAPRLGERTPIAWHRLSLGRRLRDLAARSRRATRPATPATNPS